MAVNIIERKIERCAKELTAYFDANCIREELYLWESDRYNLEAAIATLIRGYFTEDVEVSDNVWAVGVSALFEEIILKKYHIRYFHLDMIVDEVHADIIRIIRRMKDE